MDGGSTLLMENNSRVGYHNASGDTDGHGAGIYATGGVTLNLGQQPGDPQHCRYSRWWDLVERG